MKLLKFVYIFMCFKLVVFFILIVSSPIGQEAVFGMYQNSDRINVKFSTFGDWYYVSTVNTAIF